MRYGAGNSVILHFVIFASGFCLVFLSALQSRFVNHGQRVAAFLNAFPFAAANVGLVTGVVSGLPFWEIVITYGLAGGLGVIAAMTIHQHIWEKRGKDKHG